MKFPIRWSDRTALALLLALLVVAYSDILFLGRGFYISDVSVYHYPMKHVVREAVRSGEFPYWNRLYCGGAPLAANPAYELFYPPQWLVYVLPFHFGVQLHVLLHFAIAMAGMVLLLRRLGVSIAAAAFGSIAFVFCGSYVSLSSKLPILFSISWMPLALWLLMRFAEERTARRLLPLAFVLAMQLLLGEPAGVMQTWAIIAGWALLRVLRSRQKKTEAKGIAATLGVAMAAAILIAAVQLLPAIDFVRDTVRSRAFDFRVVANWSTPPVRLVELILPGVLRHVAAANGSAFITTIYAFRNDAYLTEIYAGLLIVLLAVAGVLAGVRGRWLFLGTAAASIILAMGDHTPLLRVLYDTGILSSFRFPESGRLRPTAERRPPSDPMGFRSGNRLAVRLDRSARPFLGRRCARDIKILRCQLRSRGVDRRLAMVCPDTAGARHGRGGRVATRRGPLVRHSQCCSARAARVLRSCAGRGEH
jgi:hypothetical protein